MLNIICCPIRNEEWILKAFIECNLKWADFIIFCDQNSNDSSRDIIGKYDDKVKLIHNDKEFSEYTRSMLLMEAQKTIQAKDKLIWCLDADELVLPNSAKNVVEIAEVSEKGTVFSLCWSNTDPNVEFSHNARGKFVYLDGDNLTFKKENIFHAPRVPSNEKSKVVVLDKDVALIYHMQYLDLRRHGWKNEFYMKMEHMNSWSDVITKYRMYHKLERKSYFSDSINSTDRQDLNLYGGMVKRESASWFELESKKMNCSSDYEYYHILSRRNLLFFGLFSFKRYLSHYLGLTQSYSNYKIVRLIDRLLCIFL